MQQRKQFNDFESLKRKMFLLNKWNILKVKVRLAIFYCFRDKNCMKNIKKSMRKRARLGNGISWLLWLRLYLIIEITSKCYSRRENMKDSGLNAHKLFIELSRKF